MAGGGVRAATALSGLDDALLRAEEVEGRFTALTETAVQVGGFMIVRRYGEAAAIEAGRVTAVANRVFDIGAATQLVRAALSRTRSPPDADAVTAALTRFADQQHEAHAAIDAMTPADRAALQPKVEMGIKARPDRAKMQRLAALMASPALAAEAALAARRARAAVALRFDGDVRQLATLTPADIGHAVDQLLDRTRRAAGEAEDDPRLVLSAARGVAAAWNNYVLTKLPPADTATLLAFYGGPPGRAKTRALVAAFTAQADAEVRALLNAYLIDLQARPATP